MKAVLDIYDIKKLIKATKNFISKDDNRPCLQYIRLDFDVETHKVKATAIDGYMLSVEFAPLLQIDGSFSAYIKPYLPVGAKSDYVEVTIENGSCYITVGDRSVGYKQPQINWLDTDKIIKDLEVETVVSNIYIDNEKLATMLKSISSPCLNEPTVIEFRGKNKPILIKNDGNVRLLQVIRSE